MPGPTLGGPSKPHTCFISQVQLLWPREIGGRGSTIMACVRNATYLTDDISVGYTNYHPVFGCVVLIFILNYQAFPGIVISFTLWKKRKKKKESLLHCKADSFNIVNMKTRPYLVVF